MACPFVGLDEDFVGDDVQFFLRLALYVFAARTALNADQRALVHRVGDDFTGRDDVVQQRAEVAARADVALLFDNELSEGGTVVHVNDYLK